MLGIDLVLKTGECLEPFLKFANSYAGPRDM